MATLQALRNKAGVFIAIFIGVALLAFILTDLLGTNGNGILSNSDEIGEIDGQTIKVQDYQRKVDEYEAFAKLNQRAMSLSEVEQNMIRENVWRQMVSEIAMGKAFENAGIDVSAEEMLDMVVGNHISNSVRPLFTNPQGMYDREYARQFLQNKNQDPQAAFYWSMIEKQMRDNRLVQKYASLIEKSVYCTSAQAKYEAEKRAKNVNLSFVSVRYTAIPDSAVAVSEAEIKERFAQTKDLAKVEESRSIQYVSFPVKASDEDREATLEYVESLKADFASADVDAYRFAQNNSESPVAEVFVKESQLASEVATFVATAQKGEVYGPYREGDVYKISRLVDVQNRPDSVRASHILIQNNETLADSLLNVVKAAPSKFAELARKFSTDQGSAINGGDLDWFADGAMVPEFNKVCFESAKGTIAKVKTQFGTHIVYVVDQKNFTKKYSVATIDKSVQYSSKTHQMVYAAANDFATANTTRASFDATVDSTNMVRRYGTDIRSNAYTVNAIRQARELVKWAFKADVNEVSPLFECGDEFIVAVLVEKREKGYQDINSMRPLIERTIRNEKKAKLISEAVAGKSLAEVAEMYSTTVQTAENVNFNENAITGTGYEAGLVGSVVAAAEGQVVGAVKGNNAAYVFEVSAKSDVESSEDAARAAYVASMRGLTSSVLSEVNDVEVVDNRIKFY